LRRLRRTAFAWRRATAGEPEFSQLEPDDRLVEADREASSRRL